MKSIIDVLETSPKNNIDWEKAKKKWKYHAYAVIAFVLLSCIAFYSQDKLVRIIPSIALGIGCIYMGLISFKLKVIMFGYMTANTRQVKQGAITFIIIGTLLVLLGCYIIITYLML